MNASNNKKPSRNPNGRPPERGQAKNRSISVRTTPDLYARLREVAEANGRSMTQEVEHRLIRSFDYADAADYLAQAIDNDERFWQRCIVR